MRRAKPRTGLWLALAAAALTCLAARPARAEAPAEQPAQEAPPGDLPDDGINHIRVQGPGPGQLLQGVGAGIGGTDSPLLSSSTQKEVEQAIGLAVEQGLAKDKFPPPSCLGCHGVFVRGRYDPKSFDFNCKGSTCRTCTGFSPAGPCEAFCMNGKTNLWGNAKEGLPDPGIFTKEQMEPYAALFALFGFAIPESCMCDRRMFVHSQGGYNWNYGMGYSSGACHGCVGLPNDFAACRQADWCDQHCVAPR